MYIETTKFDDAVAAVEAKVKEFGGFIEASEVNGRTEYRPDGTTSLVDRSAYYVVRVPNTKFDAFVKQSGTLGNVLSSNTSAENVTSQFTDAEARKASLKVQEERLLAMMEKTDNIKSLIELEERLTEVRYEYEAIERKLINWQNQVDYSTVSLNLQEVATYTPVRRKAGLRPLRRLERLRPLRPGDPHRPGRRPARADPAGAAGADPCADPALREAQEQGKARGPLCQVQARTHRSGRPRRAQAGGKIRITCRPQIAAGLPAAILFDEAGTAW